MVLGLVYNRFGVGLRWVYCELKLVQDLCRVRVWLNGGASLGWVYS